LDIFFAFDRFVHQVTFSEQSLSALNGLSQIDQLSIVEQLSSLSSSILKENPSNIGKFVRKGKCFYRIRLGELRVYFEKIDNALHCHYILPKNTFNDFLFRCNLPASNEMATENHPGFWDYLETLTRSSRSE